MGINEVMQQQQNANQSYITAKSLHKFKLPEHANTLTYVATQIIYIYICKAMYLHTYDTYIHTYIQLYVHTYVCVYVCIVHSRYTCHIVQVFYHYLDCCLLSFLYLPNLLCQLINLYIIIHTQYVFSLLYLNTYTVTCSLLCMHVWLFTQLYKVQC